MKKIIVLALSLAVSSFGFASAKTSAPAALECDDTNGTYDICQNFGYLETAANEMASKLAEAGAADAAMWTVSIMESAKWAFDAAKGNYRDQVKKAVKGVKERFYKAKELSEDARNKNDSIQKSYYTYRYYSREFVFAVDSWLDGDDDADDFDDADDLEDSDDSDDFDDDNESDDIDDLDDL